MITLRRTPIRSVAAWKGRGSGEMSARKLHGFPQGAEKGRQIQQKGFPCWPSQSVSRDLLV